MSVLIKNLSIPQNGYVNVTIFPDGKATVSKNEPPYYYIDFEAVDVPTPHGDLIDREVTRDNLMYEMVGTGYQSKAMKVCDEYYTMTVIEAEE